MTNQSDLESALDRLETRLTWIFGGLVYLWTLLHIAEWWTSLVLQYPWLQEWSYSDITSIVFQFGSLGFAFLAGRFSARLITLNL